MVHFCGAQQMLFFKATLIISLILPSVSTAFGITLPEKYKNAKIKESTQKDVVKVFFLTTMSRQNRPNTHRDISVKNGDTVQVFKGMKVVLKGGLFKDESPITGINLLGFKPKKEQFRFKQTDSILNHKGANDIGYVVDSAQDLLEEWQVSEGRYMVIVGNQKEIAGHFYLDLVEPQFISATLKVNDKHFVFSDSSNLKFQTTDAINVNRVKTNVPSYVPIDFAFHIDKRAEKEKTNLHLSFYLGQYKFYEKAFPLASPSLVLEQSSLELLFDSKKKL